MNFKNFGKLLFGFTLIILFSGFFTGKDDTFYEINRNIDLFGKVYKEVTFDYVDKVDPSEFMKAGIKGMLSVLDPYTVYMDKENKEDIDLITNGKYGGVGISIGVRGDLVTIVEVMDGYSAQKQGVRIGDVLIEAAGKKITPQNFEDVSSLVKGEPGTIVNLKVLRNGIKDTLSFNLVREEVKVKSLVYYGFYPANSNNVYLRLTSFSRSAGDEIQKALKELKAQKEIKSVVLDLRGNPGGLLDVAVDIVDKFLPKGDLVVSTKGRDEDSQKSYYCTQAPMLGNARLAILIDGGSASASEIVTGAIQDHDRGIVVGTKSFGKGLVQTIVPLDYNASIKITTARYYTPSGRCIQKIDYAKDNKAVSEEDSVIKGSYYTDHKRHVFGAGGITPDSTVTDLIEGDITKDLLAKGLFFQFADSYYYAHPKANLNSITDNELMTDFEKYLKTQNYVFRSPEQKQVDNLLAVVKGKKGQDNIAAALENINNEFSKLGSTEMKTFRDEIIGQIKIELADRYSGTKGEIEEELSYDDQFQTALKILNNVNEYNKILNLK
jgi:carboxyl-terminal processing protease